VVAAATNAQATVNAAATNAQATANAAATNAQATANAVATQAAQAQQVQEAPIAVSVDLAAAPGAPYEQIVTYRLLGGAPFPVTLTLATGGFTAASEISSWWLDDSISHWYLMFSDSAAVAPLNLVHYIDATDNSSVFSPVGGAVTHPIVSAQFVGAADRWVIYTRAELGPGTDRNLWQVRGNGTDWSVLADNSDFDDHDPFWTPDGQILYASGPAAGADNLYLLTPGNTPPGTQLTSNNAGVVEIASPKWCRSWDWTNEVYKNTVVFASRTSPADFWDIWTADPGDWANTLTNITNTGAVNETDPDWSPYCLRIVYVNSSPQPDVWHMARDGSDIQWLTNDANTEANPLWRPIVP
jgi:hypothetical protein